MHGVSDGGRAAVRLGDGDEHLGWIAILDLSWRCSGRSGSIRDQTAAAVKTSRMADCMLKITMQMWRGMKQSRVETCSEETEKTQ